MEPLGVRERNVPHFKGLISANLNPRAQGRDSNFTFYHTLLKKAILHLKMATVRFGLNTAVVASVHVSDFVSYVHLNLVESKKGALKFCSYGVFKIAASQTFCTIFIYREVLIKNFEVL